MGSCAQLVKLQTQSKEYSRLPRMSTIKLTYFELRARAEPCRLLLAYAGSEYEDERLPAPWDNMAPWTTLKPNTPWGQVPLLAWDGEVMAQVDEIIDVIQDLLNAWYSLYHARDSARQEKFLETNIPTTMGQLEKKLGIREGQFMVGNAFSWADLHLFFYVTEMKLMANKAVDTNYPKIANLVQRVGSIPNIKA